MHIAREPGRCIGRDISRGEAIEHELNACIEKRRERRVRDKGTRPVEVAWARSERAYTARRDAEQRREVAGGLPRGAETAVRLGNTLGALVAFHQAEAEKYRDRPKGNAA